MPKKDDSTLYDKETKRLKNKPWIVGLIVLSVAIAGLAAFLTNVMNIKDVLTPTASPPPKVRVQYYSVGGHALSFLLLGMLDPTLQKHLGGRPVVWQNQVYHELREMHNRFATPMGLYGLESPDLEREELDAILPRSAKVIQFATQESVKIDEDTLLSSSVLGNPLTAPGWKMAWIKDQPKQEIAEDLEDGAVSVRRLIFSKRLTCKDALESFEELGILIADYLNQIGSPGCDSLAFDVVVQYYDDDGGCVGGWDAYIYVPGLALDVAVVQNISDKAIRIEEIELRAAKLTGIGPAKSASPLAVSKGTVGDGTLLPNDRLIVPLSLRFSSEFMDSDFVGPSLTYSEPDLGSDAVRSQLSGQTEVRLVGYGYFDPAATEAVEDASTSDLQSSESGPQMIEVTMGTLQGQELAGRYGFTPDEPRDELPRIGTILTPTTMVVDGLREKVHSIQLGSMYISDTYAGGSCPYLYAGSSRDALLSLGKTLVQRDSRIKRGTDWRYVSAWPSLVVVEERDPETTYLQGVSLVCETPAGGLISKEPALATSPFKQGAVELRRGESQTIEFPPLEPGTQCESVFIKVEGYYISDPVAAPARNLSLITRKYEDSGVWRILQ